MFAPLRHLAKRIGEDDVRLHKYKEMMQTEGWKIHLEYLLYLQGFMAQDMFGKKFTDQDAIQKDVTQRAYSMVYDVLQFLADPMEQARKVSAVKQHNIKMGATARKQPK